MPAEDGLPARPQRKFFQRVECLRRSRNRFVPDRQFDLRSPKGKGRSKKLRLAQATVGPTEEASIACLHRVVGAFEPGAVRGPLMHNEEHAPAVRLPVAAIGSIVGSRDRPSPGAQRRPACLTAPP